MTFFSNRLITILSIMNNIFITGGTGFIGTHLVKRLLQDKENKITLLVRNTSNIKPFEKNIKKNRIKLVYGDITDKYILEASVKEANSIFHLAALINFDKSRYSELYKINVIGTKNLIDVALKFKNQIDTFLLLSSIASIRRASFDFIIADENFEYDWEKNKEETYQYTKYLMEKEIINAHKKGLNVYIANPSIVIGEGISSPLLISSFKLAKRKIFIRTKGGINLIHINDVIDGILKILDKGKQARRYILAGENVSYDLFFKEIASFSNIEQYQIYIPKFFKYLSPLKKLFTYAYYSSERANKELGWYPKHSWQDTLKETFNFLRENKLC